MSAVPRRLLTAEEFAAMPSDGLRLELVRGEITAMPPAFEDEGALTMRISVAVGQYIWERRLGSTYAAGTGFWIKRNPDTVLAPDFAFTVANRGSERATSNGWVGRTPDLVVEVVSACDHLIAVRDKIQMWLDAGVRLVWVVFPAQRVIEVWRPGQAERALRSGDTLDGEDVVPGFSVPVREVVG